MDGQVITVTYVIARILKLLSIFFLKLYFSGFFFCDTRDIEEHKIKEVKKMDFFPQISVFTARSTSLILRTWVVIEYLHYHDYCKLAGDHNIINLHIWLIFVYKATIHYSSIFLMNPIEKNVRSTILDKIQNGRRSKTQVIIYLLQTAQILLG